MLQSLHTPPKTVEDRLRRIRAPYDVVAALLRLAVVMAIVLSDKPILIYLLHAYAIVLSTLQKWNRPLHSPVKFLAADGMVILSTCLCYVEMGKHERLLF